MIRLRDWHSTPLAELGLSFRATLHLERREVETVGQLCCQSLTELFYYSSSIQTWEEIFRALLTYGLRPREEWDSAPITQLGGSDLAISMLDELGIDTVGHLLHYSSEELAAFDFPPTVLRDLFKALARRGLRLSDGKPGGPEDWY